MNKLTPDMACEKQTPRGCASVELRRDRIPVEYVRTHWRPLTILPAAVSSVRETAQVSNVSPETVMRAWRTAKARLLREIGRGQPTASK